MDLINKPLDAITAETETLAQYLQAASQYQEFIAANQAVQADEEVKRISNMIDSLQSKVKADYEGQKELIKKIDALSLELEALPSVQSYYQKEEIVCAFFAEVDQIISDGIGIHFALNARRARCSCGN